MPTILVGRITAPVGLDGSVRVESLSDVPHRFAPGAILLLQGAPHKVQHMRTGRLPVLKLEGVNTREAAERLRGAELHVPEGDSPEPPQDTYYHYQLLDMQVVDTQGNLLGLITEILSSPGNDVYVVTSNGRETLVPALADIVKKVDLAARRMVVDMPAIV
jgi:16S rRNA processing protein RimM